MKRYIQFGAAAFLSALVAHAAALTFSTCNTTGALGPIQGDCDAAYGGSPIVSVSGGIQTWTVPATGTYRITATGAQGASAQSGLAGGRGARITGDFALTAGQTLQLVVGQEGQVFEGNGGGGGGSFVVNSSDVPLLIAGGGGGTRDEVQQNGCDASTTQFAIIGSQDAQTSTCAEKAGGAGSGGIVSSGSWGSAGGGFNSDGESDCDGEGGKSWLNGMLGGNLTAPGGFGGGGDGAGCDGGGGGGGYSGGDGGRVAGGGGSYNTGADPSATAGVGEGAGTIVIEPLGTVITAGVPVPTVSEWGLILLCGLLAAGAVVTLRRRQQ